MAKAALRSTAFKGDEDAGELRDFFRPERQFAGDVQWTFGTSLKSAYVNTFEFLNHAPLVQIWRDPASAVQAVSRLSLGPGEWFHQAAPGFRDPSTARAIIEQADAAFGLLSDLDRWRTARYECDAEGLEALAQHGYEVDGRDEVFMTLPLASSTLREGAAATAEVRLLEIEDPAELRERALAQVDAFSSGSPNRSELAWIHRTLPHQLAYAPDQSANVVAMGRDGVCLAFADVYFDKVNLIGEFEPVGTRTSAQRRGLAASVLTRGLAEMMSAGMTQAIVRTGIDNAAAIAAYTSVGFEITDYRVTLSRRR